LLKFLIIQKFKKMANHKKKEEEKLNQVSCHMTDELNARLFSVASDYGLTRNEVIRIASYYLINNTKKVMKGVKI